MMLIIKSSGDIFRISIATSMENLENALQRIKAMAESKLA
jgi:hypothetical protein